MTTTTTMPPRVRTINISTPHVSDIRRAMHAAVTPFGSLTVEIADLALAYVGDEAVPSATSTIDAAIALLRATRAVHGEWSDVLLGGERVQLITPASGTVIHLRKYAGTWDLTVDFGARGSDIRADAILESAPSMSAPSLSWTIEPVQVSAEAR